MCVSPIRIPNPNYGNKAPFIVQTKDTVSRYINVPCGCCSECVSSKQMQLVQRAKAMSLDHYLFFCTLTYDNKHLPRLTTSTNFDIPFADISDVQNMIKRIRKYNLFERPFKFYFVSERGTEKGRPHFHGLIFIPKYKDDDSLYPAVLEPKLRSVLMSQWKRNVAVPVWSPKKQKYIPNSRGARYESLFTFKSKYVGSKLYKNFDLHYVVPHSSENGADDVAFYVTKYLLKPSDKERRLQQALRLNLSKWEYNEVWNTVKSKSLCSKAFGDCTFEQLCYVTEGIEKTKDDPEGFKFFSANGVSQPLAKFYRDKYVSKSQLLSSVIATGGPVYNDERDFCKKIQSIEKGNLIQSKVYHRDISEITNF